MNRKFKALGLALLAVVAVSAVSATAAQGATFTAAKYPVAIHGEQTSPHLFTYAGREVTCGSSTFVGTANLTEASHDVTVTPEYNNCHAIVLGNKLPATVTHNGCTFTFTIESTTPTSNEVHILCPAGNAIEIHVYSDATHSTSVCTYAIKPQTVKEISYSTMAGAKNDVTVATNNSLVATERTGGTLATCGGASGNATYNSKESTVRGFEPGTANQVSIDVG